MGWHGVWCDCCWFVGQLAKIVTGGRSCRRLYTCHPVWQYRDAIWHAVSDWCWLGLALPTLRCLVTIITLGFLSRTRSIFVFRLSRRMDRCSFCAGADFVRLPQYAATLYLTYFFIGVVGWLSCGSYGTRHRS